MNCGREKLKLALGLAFYFASLPSEQSIDLRILLAVSSGTPCKHHCTDSLGRDTRHVHGHELSRIFTDLVLKPSSEQLR